MYEKWCVSSSVRRIVRRYLSNLRHLYIELPSHDTGDCIMEKMATLLAIPNQVNKLQMVYDWMPSRAAAAPFALSTWLSFIKRNSATLDYVWIHHQYLPDHIVTAVIHDVSQCPLLDYFSINGKSFKSSRENAQALLSLVQKCSLLSYISFDITPSGITQELAQSIITTGMLSLYICVHRAYLLTNISYEMLIIVITCDRSSFERYYSERSKYCNHSSITTAYVHIYSPSCLW